MSIQISTIGIVFGLVLGAPLETYLPFVATGIIIWTFFAATLNDSSTAFIAAESLMKQLIIPPITYVLRVVWRNIIVFSHNLILIPIALILFGYPASINLLLFVPGIVLALVNLSWLAVFIAIIGTRFRDISPIVASLLTVGFYLTPVIWKPELIPSGFAHLLLGLNPFYHLMQVIRLPLLGELPTLDNWLVACLSGVVGSVAAFYFYRANRFRIVYWL
jgi:lipopolysaccharide transport system permease protein